MAPPLRTPRTSWIDEGLRLLARGGPDAVRIEPLAKALGVTKGGFYGHFADRGALLTAMLDAWERTTTRDVVARIEKAGGDAPARLRRLLTLTSSDVVATDLAIRDWARRDDRVAAYVQRIDDRRMGYLRSLFGTLCADPDEVEARSLLFYALLIGNHFIHADPAPRSRAGALDLALRHLVTL